MAVPGGAGAARIGGGGLVGVKRNLVVFGSSESALAVVRRAAREDFVVTIVDEAPGIAFRSRFSRKKVLVPDLSGLDAVRIRDLIGPPDSTVVCTSDRWLLYFRQHWEALGVVDWLHPAPAVLDILLDKAAFCRWCVARGITAPRWYPAPAAAGEISFPVVVRPNKTHLANRQVKLPKVRLIHGAEELAEALAWFHRHDVDAIVTESLLGRRLLQYSVPFVRKNGKTLSFVARKVRPAPARCEVGTYVTTAADEGAGDIVRDLLAGLDYEGIGEAELLYDVERRQHYLIEINARPWTQFQLSLAAGYDFFGFYFDQARAAGGGEATWVDFSSDVKAVFSPMDGLLRSGELTLPAYLGSLRRVTSFSVWDLADPLPLLYDVVKDLRKLAR